MFEHTFTYKHMYTSCTKQPRRGSGWRIHCGVEVTESSTVTSTSKQHTLVDLFGRSTGHATYEIGVRGGQVARLVSSAAKNLLMFGRKQEPTRGRGWPQSGGSNADHFEPPLPTALKSLHKTRVSCAPEHLV